MNGADATNAKMQNVKHSYFPTLVWLPKMYSRKLELVTSYVTQYNKRYILSTFEKIDIFALNLTGDLTSFPMIPNS